MTTTGSRHLLDALAVEHKRGRANGRDEGSPYGATIEYCDLSPTCRSERTPVGALRASIWVTGRSDLSCELSDGARVIIEMAAPKRT